MIQTAHQRKIYCKEFSSVEMMSQESTYALAIITCLQIPCAARSLSKDSREHGELGSRSQPWDDVSDQFGFDPSADA